MEVSSSSWGYPNGWMVYFMENPIEIRMIRGYPYDSGNLLPDPTGRSLPQRQLGTLGRCGCGRILRKVRAAWWRCYGKIRYIYIYTHTLYHIYINILYIYVIMCIYIYIPIYICLCIYICIISLHMYSIILHLWYYIHIWYFLLWEQGVQSDGSILGMVKM